MRQRPEQDFLCGVFRVLAMPADFDSEGKHGSLQQLERMVDSRLITPAQQRNSLFQFGTHDSANLHGDMFILSLRSRRTRADEASMTEMQEFARYREFLTVCSWR